MTDEPFFPSEMKRKPTTSITTIPLRVRAEGQLRLRSGIRRNGASAPGSIADTQRLLHELQVHQIELEMQNEELKKARDEMEAGMEKYTDLYDFAPVGYLTLTQEGIIREANLAGSSLLGVGRAALVSERFGSFVSPADRSAFGDFLRDVFEDTTKGECEVRLQPRGHPLVYVRMRANRSLSGQTCQMAVTDITKHKQAEEVTARLAAIVTSSSDAIIGIDLNGIITSWNVGAETLFGYSAGDMVGGPITRLLPSDRQHEEAKIIGRIKAGESIEHYETVRVAKDGRLLDMSVTISPVRHAGGQIFGASKVARDITEQKLAADKVRVSEVRYRRLFEAAHDGVILLDPATGKITDANPFMTKLLGYRREQLAGKELFEIGLLKDEAASREMFHQLMRKHEVRYEDLPLESKTGRHQEVEVVANLYEEDGHAVIQCNIRDITARKQAEAALRASEERYRALFDLGPVGVYSCDTTGKIHEFNRRAVELWGRKPKLGDPGERYCGSHKLYLPNGRRMPHAQCPMAAVLSGKIAAARDAEVIIERPDGSRMTAVVNIVPLRNDRGETIGAINCFYDVTARKLADQELLLAQKKLASYAGELENMVATRTAQLTATNRRLETAIRFTRKSKEEFRSLFLESLSMGKRLRQLTHQILTAQEEERKKISRELHDEVVQMLVGINVELSALVHGNSPGVHYLKDKIAHTQRLVEKSVDSVHRFARELRPAVLDDLGLIPALHAFCRNLADRKKMKIRMTAYGGVEALAGDKRTVLFRVAQEALTNVARHARATLVKLNISKIPGALRMEISDNGQSFPVKKIFLAKNPKRLGLVGMKERIEMVGGNLTIESTRGKGTTVRAELPFSPPPRKIK